MLPPSFLADYSCFSREYKRPIVTNSAQFKNEITMQWTSSSRCRVRPETAVINVERFAVWQPFFSAVRDVRNRGYVLLRDHRKLKWVLAMLLTFISFQSYFVRGLLAAFFFSTILYVILAALVALYLLIDHGLCRGILRVACVRHSFYPFLYNHLAPPPRVLYLPKSRASDGGQRLGHG